MVDGVNKLVKFPDERKISLQKHAAKSPGPATEAVSLESDQVISELSENRVPANLARKMENSQKLQLNEDISRQVQGASSEPSQEFGSVEDHWKEIQRTTYERFGEGALPRKQPLSSYDEALNLTRNLADQIRNAGKSAIVNDLSPTTANNLLTS